MTVKLYTAPNCGPCIGVKAWMRKNGVSYEELPASDHAEYLASLGARSAPVTVANDQVIVGLDIPALTAALR